MLMNKTFIRKYFVLKLIERFPMTMTIIFFQLILTYLNILVNPLVSFRKNQSFNLNAMSFLIFVLILFSIATIAYSGIFSIYKKSLSSEKISFLDFSSGVKENWSRVLISYFALFATYFLILDCLDIILSRLLVHYELASFILDTVIYTIKNAILGFALIVVVEHRLGITQFLIKTKEFICSKEFINVTKIAMLLDIFFLLVIYMVLGFYKTGELVNNGNVLGLFGVFYVKSMIFNYNRLFEALVTPYLFLRIVYLYYKSNN